jgi:hypothetical protein
VLVDHLAAEHGPELDRLAASDHRVGQRERLGAVQPAKEHRHAKGGHLVVGYLSACIREDELGQLVGAEAFAVALPTNELRGTDHA